MELNHEFTVPVPADQAWDVLLDISRIAPCMPGATVTSVDGDTFLGGMKIKVGPVAMTYRGEGELVEKDHVDRRAVLEVAGRDAKGNGGAQATVTAKIHEISGASRVHVVTELNITGKAAQFGAPVVKDISNRLFAQFADNVAQLMHGDVEVVAAPAPEPGPPASEAARPRVTSDVSNEAVNAFALLAGAMPVRRIAWTLVSGLVGGLIGYRLGRR